MSAETGFGARFATGEWYAVVGDRVTVLLPVSQRSRVAALWELADGGADADTLLDALLAGGLSSLDHFALVAQSGETTRVIVRGAPSARVSSAAGDEVLSAAPGTTWNEQVLTGEVSVHLALAGDGPVEHALTPGLSRVSAVELGPARTSPPAPSADTPTAAAPVATAPSVSPVEVPAEPVEPEPVSPVADAPEPVATPEPEVPAAPMSFGEPGDDPTPTGETPVVDDAWDRDGQTVAGPPTPDFERPPVPGQEVAPEVLASPVATLVFSTGDVVGVDRTVLVGRAPEARRFASHDQPHVVTVASPHQEISSTHLEIRPGAGADHGSAIATDLGSTNGTVLAQPGLDAEELTPGIAVSLVPGAVLDLGDGVTIQVTNP
ncbi:FHA domain-containing protein [Nocardioides zeicaulis]|uniref:FHA domain-containing protein n=1 Tax=Nocardioides zeicaulis TaxID=1776857 RepID=A0ABV6E3P5_9ACTN